MYSLVLTARFNLELNEIVDFIAKDSKQNAKSFHDELKSKINSLIDTPFIYRQSTSSENKQIRDLVFKGYAIPYFVDIEKNIVLVLGVFKRNEWSI